MNKENSEMHLYLVHEVDDRIIYTNLVLIKILVIPKADVMSKKLVYIECLFSCGKFFCILSFICITRLTFRGYYVTIAAFHDTSVICLARYKYF